MKSRRRRGAPRGYSAGTGRGDAAAATRIVRGDESRRRISGRARRICLRYMQEFPECPLWENCVRVVLAMTHAEVEHIMGQTNQTVDSLDNMELAPVSNFIGKYVLEDLVEEYGLNKSALTYIAERKRSFERTPPRRARDRSPNRGFDKLTIARRTEVETHAGTSRRTSTTAPRSRRNSRTTGPRRAYGARA